MGEVLDAAQQVEGMRFCMNEPAEVLGTEPEEEEGGASDDEGEEELEANVDYDGIDAV